MVRPSRWRSRNRFLLATVVVAVAAAVAALATPALANSSATTATGSTAPGYPPPKGIYKPFTNCPIAKQTTLMNESTANDAVGCIVGQIDGGSITLGNITTPVTEPVNVQFGVWDPQNAVPGGDNSTIGIEQFAGGVLPPPAGISAMVKTKPDLIPGTLTDALGCATATDPTIQNLCQQLAANPADNTVTALAQSAGQLTNFGIFTWTQRVKFKLINPLLGNNCYIGSDNNPVVLNPVVGVGPGGGLSFANDPNPDVHPNTAVLEITQAVATDNTFFAPGVTGCGPGGAANIAVDQALDAWAGLPAASGNNFTFNGNLFFADSFGSANQASVLLSALVDSASNGASAKRHLTTMAHVKGHFGLH